MTGGPDVEPLGHGCREAERVSDLTGCDLLVAYEPGQDRQAGRVGRGPPRRAQRVRPKVEDRPRARVPAAVRLRVGCVELVQLAVVAIDDEDVAIAGAAGSAFDGWVRRDRVRPRVALVRVVECHRDPGLGAGNGRVWNSDGPPVPAPGPEIRVETRGAPDAVDVAVGPRVERERVDARVPDAVSRERRASCHRRCRRLTPDRDGASGDEPDHREEHCEPTHRSPFPRSGAAIAVPGLRGRSGTYPDPRSKGSATARRGVQDVGGDAGEPVSAIVVGQFGRKLRGRAGGRSASWGRGP